LSRGSSASPTMIISIRSASAPFLAGNTADLLVIILPVRIKFLSHPVSKMAKKSTFWKAVVTLNVEFYEYVYLKLS
jgi:hypothetical protein